MSELKAQAPEITPRVVNGRHTLSPTPVVRLAAVALAMELLYLGMLHLNNLKEHVETFIPVFLLQSILYFVSVYLAEKISPGRFILGFVFVAAVLFRLTLFPLYPSLSDDLVRYRWEGKAQQAGLNPYLVRPADPQLRYLRDQTYPAVSGPQYSTLYGPLTEEVLWASYALLHGVVAMKLPFVLFDLGVVLALFRLLPALGLSPLRAIVYAWSPLTVVEFSASGHNDSLPILALVLALVFFHSSRPRLSLGAVTLSALSKPYTVFLLPAFLSRTPWIGIPVLLAALAFAPYGGGAVAGLIRGLSEYGAHWRNSESLFHLILTISRSGQQASRIYLAIVAAAVLYCWARKHAPERACFVILGTILLFSPNVFPWYLTWMVPFLAIDPDPAWLLLTVSAPLAYHVLIPYRTLGLWQENPLFAVLEYAPFYGLILGKCATRMWMSRRSRRQRVWDYET